MSENIKVFQKPNELSQALAKEFVQFVKHKDKVSVALAGGSTPKIFYETLGQIAQEVYWSKIHIFWGDERCVSPDNSDSNYLMTKTALLDKINIPDSNIHRVYGENDPKGEAKRYSDEITLILPVDNNLPKFDWIFLGLGTDGHTASLFPNTNELDNVDDLCVVATHPETGQKRISFTLPLLQNAGRISFLVTGSKKKGLFSTIMKEKIVSKQYPASLLFSNRPDCEWWIDEEVV